MDLLDAPLATVTARTIPPGRIWLARLLAGIADLVQVGGFWVTVEGVFSPVEDGLDLLMAAVLTGLVGFHVAFVPSFLIKLVPVADLAPTWTVAVLIATAGKGGGRPVTPLAPVPMLPPGDPGQRRTARSARLRAGVWFAVVCAIGFAVGQLYLMPHLPPVVGHLAPGTTGPWRQNWAGAILGGGLGLLAARTVLRRAGQN